MKYLGTCSLCSQSTKQEEHDVSLSVRHKGAACKSLQQSRINSLDLTGAETYWGLFFFR